MGESPHLLLRRRYLLENPEKAYGEWYRVLKNSGKLLVFDANWYNYLYDDEKKNAFVKDRELIKTAGAEDYNYAKGVNQNKIERIARQLPLSKIHRPQWDLAILKQSGFSQVFSRFFSQKVVMN